MDGQEMFEGVLGLVSVLVIAYLVAADATKKGRSGWMWGLLVVCTCLIAVPVYFFLTNDNGE